MENRRKLWPLLQVPILKDEAGQDMIEYGLLLASVAVLVGGIVFPTILPAYTTLWTNLMNVISTLTGLI